MYICNILNFIVYQNISISFIYSNNYEPTGYVYNNDNVPTGYVYSNDVPTEYIYSNGDVPTDYEDVNDCESTDFVFSNGDIPTDYDSGNNYKQSYYSGYEITNYNYEYEYEPTESYYSGYEITNYNYEYEYEPTDYSYEITDDPSYYNDNYYNDSFNYNISYQHYECANIVNNIMPLAITKFFVDKNISKETINETKKMLGYIKESMVNRISKMEWLDKETKDKAKEKVMKMKEIIGYPDEIMNVKYLYQKYKDIEVEDFLTLTLYNNIGMDRDVFDPFGQNQMIMVMFFLFYFSIKIFNI